ncbi:hypothetical protein AABB24_034903, partial [Solanum stoloniferum]
NYKVHLFQLLDFPVTTKFPLFSFFNLSPINKLHLFAFWTSLSLLRMTQLFSCNFTLSILSFKIRNSTLASLISAFVILKNFSLCSMENNRDSVCVLNWEAKFQSLL